MIENKNWNNEIFILIPSYNGESDIKKFLPDLLKLVPAKQILVVDDASQDNTKAICEKLNIPVIAHKINRGKGAALRYGFDELLNKGAKWILAMDSDGQHSPDDIYRFIEIIEQNPNIGIVIGARQMSIKKMPIARIFSNRMTSVLLSILSGSQIKDSQCGYRLYSAKLLKKVNTIYNRFQMESEIILRACKANFDVMFVEVQTLYCSTQSHISHILDTLRWLVAIFSVSFELLFKKQK